MNECLEKEREEKLSSYKRKTSEKQKLNNSVIKCVQFYCFHQKQEERTSIMHLREKAINFFMYCICNQQMSDEKNPNSNTPINSYPCLYI